MIKLLSSAPFSVASYYFNFRFYSSKGSDIMKSKINDLTDNSGFDGFDILNYKTVSDNSGLEILTYNIDKAKEVFSFIDFVKDSKLIDFIVFDPDEGVINLSPNFYIRNQDQAIVLFNILERIFYEMNKLSEKGFVNDPNINIPIVSYLLINLKIMGEDFKGSINLNAIYYNMFLLLIFKMLVLLAKYLETNESDFLDSDLFSDVKRL